MPPIRSLINRSAVKARFASAGFRTSQEVLDHLEAIVGAAIRQGIRGMSGRVRKTVTVEEVTPGKLLGDPRAPTQAPRPVRAGRQVNRGLQHL